jgi:hypothetical protein
MKKSLLLFLLLEIPNFAKSQAPICNYFTPYREESAQILQNLDKSQIPTGTLYEEVFPWADIEVYDGTSATDTSTNYHFFQAYSELFYSTYNNYAYTHPSNLEYQIKNFNVNSKFHHPIGIIDFDYNTIKTDAVANGLLTVINNQLFDNPNRTTTPYETKRAFLTSVLQADNFEEFYNGTHYFYFDQNFVLSNRSFYLANYDYVDFLLDGILIQRAFTNGLPSLIVPVVFSPLVKESVLTILLHKFNNQEDISRIKLKRKVIKNFTSCDGGFQIEIEGDSFDGGYGVPAYSAKGKGYVFFSNQSCNSQTIKKPVIFVDGFDPTNKRNAWTIWDKRINVELFDQNQNSVFFGEELRNNGYDIIVYDYDEKGTNRGGAGFIENNGIAFARFCEKIYNDYKDSLQQDIIVVAPSMAALVVRYGLAWAETNNIAHHVALYVSFDGPHKGAHVTSGTQNIVDLLTQYGGLKIFDGVNSGISHCNAAKQMLVNHSSQQSESMQAHPYRQQFLSNLAAVGNYPNNLRKIAISDGNRSGILKSKAVNEFDPCDNLMDIYIKRRIRFFCSGDNCNKLSINVFAMTDQSRCESIDFKVKSSANLLSFLTTNNDFTTKTLYSQPVFINKTFDKAPGGMFGPEADFELKDWQETLAWLFTGKLDISKNLMPKTTFVPTISSLDYSFPNAEAYDIYKDFDGVNVSKCGGTSPFDTVYATSLDFNHARIDAYLLSVFRDEIYGLKPKSTCSFNCPENLILNIHVTEPERVEYQAIKSITIEPNFKVDSGAVFIAQIGCNQFQSNINSVKNNNSNKSIFNDSCPFDWDLSKTQVSCENGYTKFTVFLKNVDLDSFAEVTFHGNPWYRAYYGDTGFTFILPSYPGQPHVFRARQANRPENVISITLYHCE